VDVHSKQFEGLDGLVVGVVGVEVVGVGVGVGVGNPVVMENVGFGVLDDVFEGVGVGVGVGFGVPPLAAISCLLGSGRFGLPAR
jgi:hypothetical protein